MLNLAAAPNPAAALAQAGVATGTPPKSANPVLPASVVPKPEPTAPAVAMVAYHAPVYAATLAAIAPSACTISAAMPATATTAVLATGAYSSKTNPKYNILNSGMFCTGPADGGTASVSASV